MSQGNNESNLILTTPVRNEERNIKETVEHVINQKIRPFYWIIIDDYSTDNTYKIIQQYVKKNPWIVLIKSPFKKKKEYALGFHISKLKSYGLKYGIKISKNENKKIKYFGILDADDLIPENYIEKSIEFLSKNPEYGIISPYFTNEERKGTMISGGAMILTSECYNDIGGIIVSLAFDSATRAKAIMKGWKTIRVDNIIVDVRRKTASTIGLDKGFYHRGQAHWYLGQSFYIILIKAIYYSIRKHPRIGFSFIRGYLLANNELKNNIKKSEPLIYEYYHTQRPKDIINELFIKTTK
jgi:glycosyltransferase involved in cell wall biosynthesis